MKKIEYFMVSVLSSLLVIGVGCSPEAAVPTANNTVAVEGESPSSVRLNPNYFNGDILAGETSPYLEFNQADYDRAVAEDKVIFLDFYANWCPICRAEAPDIEEGFNGLTSSDVVGFRVNYNDTETDAAEEALAEQYGITYQHTKVIIKNDQVITKSQDTWDTATFNTEITQAL